jgi:hypothetical protein
LIYLPYLALIFLNGSIHTSEPQFLAFVNFPSNTVFLIPHKLGKLTFAYRTGSVFVLVHGLTPFLGLSLLSTPSSGEEAYSTARAKKESFVPWKVKT